ncbi:hypothetical protein ACM9HF_00550 [Colwellia sp. RE-S-Sl-9]
MQKFKWRLVKKIKDIFLVTIIANIFISPSYARVVLMGENTPYANVNDGNFTTVWSSWRAAKQSPFWTTRIVSAEKDSKMGLHLGSLYSNASVGIAESNILNTHPNYQQMKAGDIIRWEFGADLEYISDGKITFSLVFGEHERILAKNITLTGSDKLVEHFSGKYQLLQEDVQASLPFVRVTFYTSHGIKIFLNYVNISIEDTVKDELNLQGEVTPNGVYLNWQSKTLKAGNSVNVYRGKKNKKGIQYTKIATTQATHFLDNKLINGIEYTYVITPSQNTRNTVSKKVTLIKQDLIAPKAPTNLTVTEHEAEINISWKKSQDVDVASYSLYRGDASSQNMQVIAHNINKTSFVDFTPKKSTNNRYVVYAHDYSGNTSKASKSVFGKVKMIKGASFNDLILPMPIHKSLRTDLWGADGVLPRDADNGIEDANWSYWGGRPIQGKDGKYHMHVTRWPANATKGHWEWPHSTVSYTVSDKPTGPYLVKKDLSYKYMNGLGHNPDIILLNDGRYMLYSLINFQPILLVSDTIQGPWQYLGVMDIDTTDAPESPKAFYRFERNLSGVQLDDGRFLFVTKAGAMMISKNTNPLGPYKVLTSPLQNNKIIPQKYRNSNYEDPVLWKDEVQYHMIINAFLDYRAIYLRSIDGIHWKFNSGTAYTPNSTGYEDGTRTYWYKLERPHVLTDQYGRATHLSLAAIDVPKRDDLARDKHNSKNIILPLTVHRRLKLLDDNIINDKTTVIRVLVMSEAGFNAHNDIDITSLRFGAPEQVDFGNGSKVLKTIKQDNHLVIEFDGESHGFTADNFVGKMLGKTKKGELLIGFVKLIKH